MLYRSGWGASSFCSLCLQAAGSCAILSDIAQDMDLELLVNTLVESNYAVVHGVNDDVITIYPYGVPPPPTSTNEYNAAEPLQI
jgi:hypothetical protein